MMLLRKEATHTQVGGKLYDVSLWGKYPLS